MKISFCSISFVFLSSSLERCTGRTMSSLAFLRRHSPGFGNVPELSSLRSKAANGQNYNFLEPMDDDALVKWTNTCNACLFTSFLLMALPLPIPFHGAALLPTFLWISISWMRGELDRVGFISSFGPFVSAYLLLLMNTTWMKHIGSSPRVFLFPALAGGLYGLLAPEVAADDVGLELHTKKSRDLIQTTNHLVAQLAILYWFRELKGSMRHWGLAWVAFTVVFNAWHDFLLRYRQRSK